MFATVCRSLKPSFTPNSQFSALDFCSLRTMLQLWEWEWERQTSQHYHRNCLALSASDGPKWPSHAPTLVLPRLGLLNSECTMGLLLYCHRLSLPLWANLHAVFNLSWVGYETPIWLCLGLLQALVLLVPCLAEFSRFWHASSPLQVPLYCVQPPLLRSGLPGSSPLWRTMLRSSPLAWLSSLKILSSYFLTENGMYVHWV